MVTHFTIPTRSKNLTYFTNLNSLNIVKNILPQHSRKATHFTNFLADIFLVGVKKILHSTISRRPKTPFSKHWKSKCLNIPVDLRKKFLSDGEPNNFLKAPLCLGLVKSFIIFHFSWKTWKVNYISAFWYLYQ